MNRKKILIIIFIFSFGFSKTLIPSNGNSVVIQNDEKREYVYYELNKNGLEYNNISKEFSKNDSVRIKLFIRSIVPDNYDEDKSFQIIKDSIKGEV